MKWLAVVLIVTNLAAYLLVGGRQTSTETVGSDVNKTGVLLLGEVDASQPAAAAFHSQPDGTGITGARTDGPPVENDTKRDTDTATAGDMPDQATVFVENSIDGSRDQPVVWACYRLGPFRREDSWQAAKMWMDESGFEFRPVTSGSRQLLAFRVYLGPFVSESSVDAILKTLESRGLEHFRYRADNGLTRISMGLFSQEELAEKHLNYLISNQYEAKSQSEYRHLGPFNWMEVPSVDMDRAQLSGHEWDESGVRMTKVHCQI